MGALDCEKSSEKRLLGVFQRAYCNDLLADASLPTRLTLNDEDSTNI